MTPCVEQIFRAYHTVEGNLQDAATKVLNKAFNRRMLGVVQPLKDTDGVLQVSAQ